MKANGAVNQQLESWCHSGFFLVWIYQNQSAVTASFGWGRVADKPNTRAPREVVAPGEVAQPHGSLRGAFPVGNFQFGSIQPNVGSEINIF